MKYRKAGTMRAWLTKLLKGKVGREADEAYADAMQQLRERRERCEAWRQSRASGILAETPASGTDAGQFHH